MEETNCTTDNSDTSKKTIIKFILIGVVSLSPWILYLTGNGYHEAYLAVFGISADAFQIPIQSTYIKALEAITHSFWGMWEAAQALFKEKLTETLFTLFVSALAICIFFVILMAKPRRLEWLEEINPKAGFVLALLLMTGGTMYLLVALPAFFMIAWGFVFYFGQFQGYDQAIEDLAKFETQGCLYTQDSRWGYCSQLVAANGQTIIQEGLLVIQEGNRVAFFNGSQSIILDIPEGGSIRTAANPAMVKKSALNRNR